MTTQDRILEIYADRIQVQGDSTAIFYKDIEFYSFTRARETSSGLMFPCLAVFTVNKTFDFYGVNNPKVVKKIHNLLSNRIKFHPTTAEDFIDFEYGAQPNTSMSETVKNNG
jgi:hypothetical protein